MEDHGSTEHQLAELNQRMHKVERFMLYSSIVGTARLLLILVPIILAVIFIPPFVKEYLPFVSNILSFIQDFMQRSRVR